MVVVREGSVSMVLPQEGAPTRKLPVFYNPAMKLARDVLVAFFSVVGASSFRACFPLAGCGVRVFRLLRELPEGVFCDVVAGDINPVAVHWAEKNAERLGLAKAVQFFREDARVLLLRERHFDVVDVDPFGSPNPFLDAAVQSLKSKAYLAVTATDTASLAGAYRGTCRRKYWSRPLSNFLRHEAGLRILVRKVQLVAAQHGKAAVPVLSYAKEHYYRVMFFVEKSRKGAEDVLREHGVLWCSSQSGEVGFVKGACFEEGVQTRGRIVGGPLWVGALGDPVVLERAAGAARGDAASLLSCLAAEARVGGVVYSSHVLAGVLGVEKAPGWRAIAGGLEKRGFLFARSHLGGEFFRTNAPFAVVRDVLQGRS
ncbi:hypothetical protein D6783_01045 [Candidatus Woesearchaeota archaeon]|nr:MAG: hypothetical protein D6783_01045 [Candidatus Woesearchaeota archaeon]